ncbi:MAG: hypothetical protein CMH61_00475 [Nanoarchaeota archaeon]|nr:hypothetical protein [Nanoarchaeota archaeon]|tara:strand:+ start:1089 stop:1781 length:693 start_codon:yes stop_codon:yes gene_type:complete
MRLGIIGGLGPATSCAFCLNVNNRVRKLTDCQPDIVLENLPISTSAERNIIHGNLGFEHCRLLMQAVERLNRNEVDFIVIPCNTVHVFINELRENSHVPILSIIEECAKECQLRGFRKVGLLGSTKTVNEKLHDTELEKCGIQLITLNEKNQEKVSEILIKIIHNKATEADEAFLIGVIDVLRTNGAEAVILGCTELGSFIRKSSLPLLDTLSIFEDETVNLLTNKKKTI